MVRIGTVWDRTVEVIGGRTNMLAGIAVATLLVPTLIRDALAAFGGVATGGLSAVVAILVVIVMLFGQLAITAVASDPATTQAEAYGVAKSRLGLLLIVALVVFAALIVAFVPVGVMLASAGFDFQAAAAGQRIAPTANGGLALYMLVVGIAMLVIGARLAVMLPVIVNERVSVAAFARSFRLTRGMTWKLIGVMILYAIVTIVGLLAATSITGLVFRLILGGDSLALVTFMAAVAGAIVTTILAVVQTAFVTQLYVALRTDREPQGAMPAA